MNLQEINIRQKLYIILAENGIAGCNNHKINNMLSEEKKDISLSSSLNTRKWWLNGYWEATQKHLFIHMKRIRIIIIKSKIFIEMNTVRTCFYLELSRITKGYFYFPLNWRWSEFKCRMKEQKMLALLMVLVWMEDINHPPSKQQTDSDTIPA